jgi:hypothetical protein
MVSMLAIGPEDCGFKPGQGNGFLRVIKMCSMPSFGKEVKPSPHVVRFYCMLKIPSKYEQRHFIWPHS